VWGSFAPGEESLKKAKNPHQDRGKKTTPKKGKGEKDLPLRLSAIGERILAKNSNLRLPEKKSRGIS